MSLTDEEYCQQGGLSCLYCSAEDIEQMGAMDVGNIITVQCNVCKQKWYEHYRLIGWEPLEDAPSDPSEKE